MAWASRGDEAAFPVCEDLVLRYLRHAQTVAATRGTRLWEALGLVAGWVQPGAIESLRSALAYSRSQCFGRCGAVAPHFMSRRAAGPCRKVDDEIKVDL
eukprot:10916775-Heterocapsa_arctica.AAC.1